MTDIALLESLLDSDSGSSGDDFFDTQIVKPEDISPIRILEPGEIDPRLLRTSYSSNLSMHGCPRKHQLKCLGAERVKDESSELTFAFGHVVGQGIQDLMLGKSWQEVVMTAFLGWKIDLLAENARQAKSFFYAYHALQQFRSLRMGGFLDDYEVAEFEGKPAAELSFRIKFPHTAYRGFVDLVLRHKWTGEILVLELKTSSANYIRPSAYKNSAQAIGYSVVLDKIQPGLNSYGVLYLVYLTRLETFEKFEFPKTYHQRALWLRDRLIDENYLVTLARQEGSYGIWPMYGEHCNNFGRDCEYMDACHLDTTRLMIPLREKHYKDVSYETGEEVEYQFEFTIEELLAAQEQVSAEVDEGVTWGSSDITEIDL